MDKRDIEFVTYALENYRNDPVKFVCEVFPWGQAGTPLMHHAKPRRWQQTELELLADHLAQPSASDAADSFPPTYKRSIASGRGIGKSAYVSWLANWMLTCVPGSSVIVSASGEPQLRDFTFPEIKKWATLLPHSHLFSDTSLRITPKRQYAEFLRDAVSIDCAYHYIQGRLWSEENPNGFAGLHNHYGTLVIYDEASIVPRSINTVTEGFFTDPAPVRIWTQFSNPRETGTAFNDTFNSPQWSNAHINGFDVEGIDHSVYDAIIERYGADSDEARIEVYGQFPMLGDNAFIGLHHAQASASRAAAPDRTAPLVFGVDVARFGRDSSVIAVRRGNDASLPPTVFDGLDTMALASRVARLYHKMRPVVVFVDEVGVGAGVVDRLKMLNIPAVGVNAGARADASTQYQNKRAEMWDTMKTWVLEAGVLHQGYVEELTRPYYKFSHQDKLCIESKDDMKKRQVASPDRADALALTFAEPVINPLWHVDNPRPKNAVMDYNEF